MYSRSTFHYATLFFFILGSVSQSFSQQGGVAWFDAPTETYVDIGSSGEMNCLSDLQNGYELSVTMWVKWDDKNASGVGNWANRLTYADSAGNGDNGTFWCQHNNTNQYFEFAVQNTSTREYVYSTTEPQEGEWYHVAGVFNGWQLKIFVDGNLENTTSLNFPDMWNDLNVSAGSKLNMGRWSNQSGNHRYFDGAIDEVSLWNRALSSAEVQDIMNNAESVTGSSYDANGLIGFWNFDDHEATDLSPCGNSGDGSDGFATVPADGSVTRTIAAGDCNDPANWDAGVPNDTTTALVEHSMSMTGKITTRNLVLQDSLDQQGDSIIVKGDLINKGQLTCNGGALEFNGTTTDVREIVAKEPLEVSRMAVDVPSKVDLDTGILNIRDELIMVTGTLDIAKKRLTLLSDSSGTARVGAIPPGSSIKGKVGVQRWIASGNAGWIDMAAPNKDGVTLAEWDDDIYLSGKQAGGFNDGCAWSNGCFWSVKRSDSTGALVDVTSTSEVLENGRGYELFIGDNGGVNVMNNDTTVTVKGTVNESGSITLDVNDNGWTLIGNPFASPVNFDQVILNNVDPYYYVAAATGSYEWYDKGSGTSSHSNVGPIISSSQGFWVYGTGSNASVTFEQNHKTNAGASFAKDNAQEPMELVLRDVSNNLTSTLLIQSTRNGGNPEVAHKATPILNAPDLYAMGQNEREVRSRILDENEKEQIVPLRVAPDHQGIYNFESDIADDFPYRSVTLEDRASGREYDLHKNPSVQVQLSSSDSAQARFYLHLSKDEPTALSDIPEGEEGDLKAYSDEEGIVLRNEGSTRRVHVNVYDASGRNVHGEESVISASSTHRIPMERAEGIYLIQMKSPEGSTTERVHLGASR